MTLASAMSVMPTSGDKVDIAGSLEARDCTVSYWLGGRKLTVAIVQRDLELEFSKPDPFTVFY
jgi:hypothetical protein